MLDIDSPSGISSATIKRLGKEWPKTLVVRLHIKGLENLKVSNEKFTLQAAASVQQGQLSVRQWKDKQETPGLDKKSPLWMNVQIFEGKGPAKKLPLENGHIDVTLPAALFEGNPTTVTVAWIDFFR